MTEDSEQAALLRAVHDEHSQSLLRYVLRLTRGDMAFAEDVVQESMLRLWRKPELLQQGTDVRAWLYTVARNQVIDDRRSARYARELKTDSVPEQTSPDEIGPAFDKWILSENPARGAALTELAGLPDSGRGRDRSGRDRCNRVPAVAPRGWCRAAVHATDQKRDLRRAGSHREEVGHSAGLDVRLP